MDPIDDELDRRLRAVSKPRPEAVARVTARAMASSGRERRVPRGLLAMATAAAVFGAALGLRYWPRHPAGGVVPMQGNVGVVLIRAPDGSSAIYSTGADADTLPPGIGFLISEGDQ